MPTITLANGETIEVECLSCAITGGIIEPEGGTIIETDYFHAHQDVAYPIEGLIILTSKRHFACLDELTDYEMKDYMNLLQKLRRAQREILGIKHVYYFYNEDTTHHFHTWMIPRYDWMYQFGRSIESVRPVLLHAREKMNTPENKKIVMQAVASLTQAVNHD
ncbi:MAG: HIT family protein [Bacillota bacterium]